MERALPSGARDKKTSRISPCEKFVVIAAIHVDSSDTFKPDTTAVTSNFADDVFVYKTYDYFIKYHALCRLNCPIIVKAGVIIFTSTSYSS